MGFLSAYSNVKRVVIGDPKRGYWVDLRYHIPVGDKEEADRALTQATITVDQETQKQESKIVPDATSYRQLMTVAAIAAWNLDGDDEHGNTKAWPVDLEHVRMLPGDEFDKLWKIIDSLGDPETEAEKVRFPDDSVVGDPDGDARTAEPANVPS